MNHNRVCNLSDFEDSALRDVLDDMFNSPDVYGNQIQRKSAEIASAIMALREGGVLRPDARILGVGAGVERTIFYLTRHVAEVHATDMYAEAGIWAGHAPARMLTSPILEAPIGYDWNPQRLIVQHMDARELRYPDAHFDAVFTSSSIEHFGTREDVAAAAREMGRVLKPGGIAAISTEWMISGSPYMGFGGVLLFDEDAIQRYIVEPSGLEMIDALQMDVDEDTLGTEVTLASAIEHMTYPHIVLRHEGYLFTSVHLALRKPGGDGDAVEIRHDDQVVERIPVTPHKDVPDEKPASITSDTLPARKRTPKKSD